MPGRDRDGARTLQVVTGHIVLNVLELVVFHIERIAAIHTAKRDQSAFHTF